MDSPPLACAPSWIHETSCIAIAVTVRGSTNPDFMRFRVTMRVGIYTTPPQLRPRSGFGAAHVKPHLLYRDRDLPWRSILAAAETRGQNRARHHAQSTVETTSPPRPWNAPDIVRDLCLDRLFDAMADDDELVRESAATVVLNSMSNSIETIRYRQSVLQDCLINPDLIWRLYDLATEAYRKGTHHYVSALLTKYPIWSLRHSTEVLTELLDPIAQLRTFADNHHGEFGSEGWRQLFTALHRELDDHRIDRIRAHLKALQFEDGLLLSARVGADSKGYDYRLHRPPTKGGGRLIRWLRQWFPGLFDRSPRGTFDFEIPPRDESGVRSLDALRNRGLAMAATTLGQAADHVCDFFAALRCELAFYIGCLRLHERLAAQHAPLCVPSASTAPPRRLLARNLRDLYLLLGETGSVVGNDVKAEGKDLIVITGANEGGKSTFLRSLGTAQMMMQSGLFVTAESFTSSRYDNLYTHYRREEDVHLVHGKLEEELARMKRIIDHMTPNALVLCNESFASTNEREGSEIARQLTITLLKRHIPLFFVTHLSNYARDLHERAYSNVLFLRAERRKDGVRTFRVIEGEPLQTGFSDDLYARIFGEPESQPPLHKAR